MLLEHLPSMYEAWFNYQDEEQRNGLGRERRVPIKGSISFEMESFCILTMKMALLASLCDKLHSTKYTCI